MIKQTTLGLRTWLEIDTKAIKNNYREFRKLISQKTKLMAVVKSNAYGHGLVRFSKEMEKLGADWLGVDSIVEGLRLREEGIKLPILVLGYTLPEMLQKAAEQNISLTVSTFELLKEISKKKFSKPLKIHIKVDSGMHRQGFLIDDLPEVLKILKTKDYGLKAQTEGLYTHFAAAKNPAFPEDTLEQIAVFNKWVSAFKKAGLQMIAHASATSGAILFPQAHFDMVRVGIGMYGLWPSKETKEFAKGKIRLEPVLTWKTVISEIKKLKNGERIGYDFTGRLDGDSVVGICPIGYWHGLPRSVSSIGEVLVGSRRAKIIGRVSMDMININLTGITGTKVGAEAVVIGKSGKEYIGAEDIANIIDASWYEIITRINPLIAKIYI